MKRINMDLLHYVLLLAVVLFIILSLNSCKVSSANIVLNENELVIDKMKDLHVTKNISLKSDTSKVEEVQIDGKVKQEFTGDFRYDNMFK